MARTGCLFEPNNVVEDIWNKPIGLHSYVVALIFGSFQEIFISEASWNEASSRSMHEDRINDWNASQWTTACGRLAQL